MLKIALDSLLCCNVLIFLKWQICLIWISHGNLIIFIMVFQIIIFFCPFLPEWSKRPPFGGQRGSCPSGQGIVGARSQNRLRHEKGKHRTSHRIPCRTGTSVQKIKGYDIFVKSHAFSGDGRSVGKMKYWKNCGPNISIKLACERRFPEIESRLKRNKKRRTTFPCPNETVEQSEFNYPKSIAIYKSGRKWAGWKGKTRTESVPTSVSVIVRGRKKSIFNQLQIVQENFTKNNSNMSNSYAVPLISCNTYGSPNEKCLNIYFLFQFPGGGGPHPHRLRVLSERPISEWLHPLVHGSAGEPRRCRSSPPQFWSQSEPCHWGWVHPIGCCSATRTR